MHSWGIHSNKTKGVLPNSPCPCIFQPFKTVIKYLAKTSPSAISTAAHNGKHHEQQWRAREREQEKPHKTQLRPLWCSEGNFLTHEHVYKCKPTPSGRTWCAMSVFVSHYGPEMQWWWAAGPSLHTGAFRAQGKGIKWTYGSVTVSYDGQVIWSNTWRVLGSQ